MLVDLMPIKQKIAAEIFKKIGGDFEARDDRPNPTVIPFSVSAVVSELIEMMTRTLHLPLKIIQPLLPEEQGGKLP
jgi:hypothetical protein